MQVENGKRVRKGKLLELGKQVTLALCYLRLLFLFLNFLNDFLIAGSNASYNLLFEQIFTIREMHISRLVENIFCRAKWKKKKKVQRKIDESCETLIAEFPRCDEIVKRFMKAFMKGFTSHGPNWGPEFASATHVLSQRRAPWNPAGPYSHPPPLFIFPSSRCSATSRVFSIDPRKCLVFHHHHIRRRYLVSCPIASFSLFSFSFLFALPFSADIFHDRYFPRLNFFRYVNG